MIESKKHASERLNECVVRKGSIVRESESECKIDDETQMASAVPVA